MGSRTNPRARGFRRALGLALVLIPGMAALSCRKSEPAGTAAPPVASSVAPKAVEPTAVLVAAPGPSIRAKAEPGGAPFSGLAAPQGAAFDGQGRLWIVDTGKAAIRIFAASGGSLGGWGGLGTGDYAMKDPMGIAIRGDNVYVADTYRTGVELFSTAGQWKSKVHSDLYAPHGVAVGRDGKVWIADSGNDRLVVCDADLSGPRSIGKGGSGPSEFSGPTAVAVSPSGKIYVADTGNRRVQILDASGRFESRFPFPGWASRTDPYLEVDQDESVYATDSAASAVVQLDARGKELRRWTKDDAGRSFGWPTGLALDRRNRTLVVVNTTPPSVTVLSLSRKR